jgi:hypothetical protein
MNNINVFNTLFDQTDKVVSNYTEMEKKAIENAIILLGKRGCQYKVIDLDGKTYTNVQEKEARKRRTQHFKEYVTPILDGLNVGDSIKVPFDKYDGGELQANLCARAGTRWGHKSIMTSVNKQEQVVEVIRLI